MRRVDQWEVVAAVAMRAREVKLDYGGYASAFRVASTVDRLARIARTLHRLYEVQCNEPIECCDACGSVAGRKHVPAQCFYARLERLEKRAEKIGKEIGIIVTHQRDPRGAALKLWADKEDGRSLGVLS